MWRGEPSRWRSLLLLLGPFLCYCAAHKRKFGCRSGFNLSAFRETPQRPSKQGEQNGTGTGARHALRLQPVAAAQNECLQGDNTLRVSAAHT